MAFLAFAAGALGIVFATYELSKLNEYFDEVYGA